MSNPTEQSAGSLQHKPFATTSTYPYRFSRDWFDWQIPNWDRLLNGIKHEPNLNFMEIGSFEGRSSVWLFENVLTHPSSTLTCVDIFDEHSVLGDAVECHYPVNCWENFNHNIQPFKDRTYIHRGLSQEILRSLPLYHYEFIYIDGSHRAPDTLEDTILSFRLLKPGGLLIWDDYLYELNKLPLNSNEMPKPAIDAFLQIFADQYDVLQFGYQVAILKRDA